jgi:hypothetical protein
MKQIFYIFFNYHIIKNNITIIINYICITNFKHISQFGQFHMGAIYTMFVLTQYVVFLVKMNKLNFDYNNKT